MLWRRCSNVEATSWQRWRATSQRRYNSHFRPCHNVTTSTTTLWQRCHNVAVPAEVESLSERSFIQIKYINGPRMGPWGTPAVIFENWLLKTTRRLLSLKKSRRRLSKFPNIPFWIRLKMIPSCHTLLNAFEMSRKTFLSSWISSKIYINLMCDGNCPIYSRVTWFKTRMIWRDNFIFNKKIKHFIKG